MKLILRRLLIVGLVIFVLRIGLGLGIAWLHYSNTEEYSAYLQTHPVSSEFLDGQVHLPKPLHVGDHWQKGDVDPKTWSEDSDFVQEYYELSIKLNHGDDLMLNLKQRLAHALVKEPWDYLGFHYSTPVLETGKDLRATVLIWLDGSETCFAEGAISSGEVVVDVFLVSGSGETQIKYLDLAGRKEAYQNLQLTLPLNPSNTASIPMPQYPYWRYLTGIICNLEDLPEEGLVHFFSTRNHLPYKNGGILGMNSMGRMHFSNTDEYSYSYEIQRIGAGVSGSVSNKASWSQTQEWNGKTW